MVRRDMQGLLGMGLRIQRRLEIVIRHIWFDIRIYRNVLSGLMGLLMKQKVDLICRWMANCSLLVYRY